MKNPRKYLNLAAKIANLHKDNRIYCLGAIALRRDNVIVSAHNGHPLTPEPISHCEARLVRKLDHGATVYLARLTKDGQWANSKPCPDCMRAMKRARVKKVFYTSGPSQWDSLKP